jgi:hypothetical protein
MFLPTRVMTVTTAIRDKAKLNDDNAVDSESISEQGARGET